MSKFGGYMFLFYSQNLKALSWRRREGVEEQTAARKA